MSSRYIRMTETEPLSPAMTGGAPAVMQYARLSAVLDRAGLSDLTPMFAEPVMGRGDTSLRAVSWYTPLQGNAVPLTDLAGDERAGAEQHLKDQLGRLRRLLADAEAGPLLRSALCVPSLGDVHIVFGQPVLTNWGFLPHGTAIDDPAIAAHWSGGLGGLAGFALPEYGSVPVDVAPHHGAAVAAAPAPVIAAATVAAAAAAPTIVAVVETRPWHRRPWVWVAIAALFLIPLLLLSAWEWMWSPGARALAMERALNYGLEDLLQKGEQGLQGDVCALPVGPFGRTGREPVAPVEGDNTPAPGPQPDQTNPANPANPAVPPDQHAADQPQQPNQTPPAQPAGEPRTVAQMAESGVVFVFGMLPNDKGMSMGSGILVAPNIVATNRHVIKDAEPTKIFITSRSIGHVHKATIVAISDVENRDYAILKIDGEMPATSAPLRIAESVDKLDNIYTAGYPARIIESDPAFERLLKGDASAAPDLVLNSGVVNAIMDYSPKAIVHSAMISQGNSGGPLIDQCGRVVGINTFIRTADADSSSEPGHAGEASNFHQANYALVGSDLAAFLKSNGVQPTISSGRCRPNAQAQN